MRRLKNQMHICLVNKIFLIVYLKFLGVECLKIRIEDHPHAKLDTYFDMVADKIKSIKVKLK